MDDQSVCEVTESRNKDKKNKFIPVKVTALKDLENGSVKELPESDLTIQTDTHIIQWEFKDLDDEREITTIKSGCYNFEDTPSGIKLKKFKLKKIDLLESIDNTTLICSEGNKFFSRLDVYKDLERDPKRAILLSSKPGIGKTAAINQVCQKFLQEKGTAVVIWDTSDVRSSSINRFFLNYSKFSKETKRLILVMEDIGGASVDDYEGPRGADAALLNLLDGVGNPFKGLPTFIIATTNNPETSVEALIDRPGRFDKVIELKAPNAEECKELYKFIMKKERLSSSEVEAAKKSAKNDFSIAHIQESIVRSLLDDITVEDAVDELIKHKERFKDAFNKSALSQKGERKIGFGS